MTLKHNYLGTQRLLDLAQQLPGLGGFVHISTAFVNCWCAGRPCVACGAPTCCRACKLSLSLVLGGLRRPPGLCIQLLLLPP